MWKRVVLAVLLGILLFITTTVVYVMAQIKNVIETQYQPQIDQMEGSLPQDCGIFGCVGKLIMEQGCALKSYNDVTNILLLGMGGQGHVQGGSDLTDTLIVVSLNHTDSTVSMMSLPRDLWVKPDNIQPNKINALYGISQRVYENKRLGYVVPKETIEGLFDIPIHYYAVIDFQGFVDVIDALGGVDVNVEKAFTDYQYPNGKYGYTTISFEEGLQHMDGEKALQYVRSRHSKEEGGDFSRSRRQQNVIAALKDKVLSPGTIFKITSIAQAMLNNYDSNIMSCELIRFLSIAKNFDIKNIRSLVLDDGPSGVLYTPTNEVREEYYGGQYVLLPDGNDYSIIGQYVHTFLNKQQEKLQGKVAILNGTGVEGLANKVGALLLAEGIEVVERGNTTNRVRFQETMMYDVSQSGTYIDTIEHIQEMIGGKLTPTNPESSTHNADILLILGADYKQQ